MLALHAAARLFLLFAIGTALFRLLLAPPHMAPTLRRATRWLAVGGLASLILFVGAEGALRAGLPIGDAFSAEALQAALGASNTVPRGVSAIGLVLLAIGGGRVVQWLGIACALAGMADSGHVLAVLPAGVGHGLMILHGLAAALWIGAIAPLRSALARDAGDGDARACSGASRGYGALAMAATLASGIALAWLLLPRLADLWQSDYGLRLCAKLAAVAVMLAIAATNRLWLTRRALAGRRHLRGVLHTILELDLIAAILAMVLAVGLSLGPPPAPSVEHAIADDAYTATLSLEPGRIGDNRLVIALSSKAGAPVGAEGSRAALVGARHRDHHPQGRADRARPLRGARPAAVGGGAVAGRDRAADRRFHQAAAAHRADLLAARRLTAGASVGHFPPAIRRSARP